MIGNAVKQAASDRSPIWMRAGRRALVRLLLIGGTAYLLLLGLLLWNEPRLVYPGAVPREQHYATLPANTQEVWITAADGAKLHAWLLKADAPRRTILFCHGNAENVGRVGHGTARKMRDQLQADVLVVDYRGFGRTGGEATEQRVIADCAAALEWLAKDSGKSPEQLTLFGRSLGGGIAVQLASRFGARELIIDRTFDSLASPAARKVPWIPVGWLMQNRFQSDEAMERCRMPVFQSHFLNDELIPIECARALFARVQNPQSVFLELPGGSHLTPLPDSYWPALREFLAENEEGQPGETERKTQSKPSEQYSLRGWGWKRLAPAFRFRKNPNQEYTFPACRALCLLSVKSCSCILPPADYNLSRHCFP